MLVTPDNFLSCIEEIRSYKYFALDTETTGLNAYANDRLFSVAIATPDQTYYFDYNEHFSPVLCYQAHNPSTIVNGYGGIVIMHNAKFDMAMMEREDTDWDDIKIHCTQAIARVECSSDINLSLANLGKKIGNTKSDKVKEYILEHKLWEWFHRPGKKAREKNMFFYKVPLAIIGPYAETDASVTLAVFEYQLRSLQRQNRTAGNNIPSLYPLLQNERRLTKVFYRMERRGITLDVAYTKKAIAHEQQNYEYAAHRFQLETGHEFKDSGKLFTEIFDKLGLPYGTSKTGKPSFDEEALKKVDHHHVAKLILEYRDAYKKAGTYESILSYSIDGVLHANAKQAGCVTGRVSYSDPPMQCMEKAEGSKEKFLIRRCFIPRPGYTFFMLDYDQMEYRMMLNYANQEDLIAKVNAGLDVHTATAEMMNTERKYAKTINFMLLYGGGVQKLADALGLIFDKAEKLKASYFKVLPRVESLINSCISAARNRGYIFNWFGRRCKVDKDFCYKAPNYLIQGGCADWMKLSMVQIDELLQGTNSHMLLSVHDEIIAEIAEGEEYLVPKIQELMQKPSNHPLHEKLPYTVGIDYSKKSWQDKEEWNG